MAHDTFQAGDLTAVIGDNAAYDGHRAGYNGVHRLTHRTEPESIFVPGVAGLNLEHIFDGDQELRDVGTTRQVFFEPRNAPMTFTRLSERSAELHQPPTPTFLVESWTRFTLTPPHYLDFEFRFRPTQHVFKYGYVGLFWASYIDGPDDKSTYFRGDGQWQQLCTPRHNHFSTVVHCEDRFEPKFTPNTGDALFKNFSPLRFDEPFFYGLFRNHLFLLMFDRAQGLRFTHSPSGGGVNRERQTSNPAWDFQFLLPTYDVLKDYRLRARAVYRERCPRAEVLAEVAAWRKVLGG